MPVEERHIPVVAVGVVVLIVIVTFFIAGIAGNRQVAVPGLAPGSGESPGGGRAGGEPPGGGAGPGEEYPTLLPVTDTTPLSDAEVSFILLIQEEEQMAHDLYVRWAGRYPTPVFPAIAESETRHIGEVRLLIDRYGLSGHRAGNASSGYLCPVIQSFYNSLRTQGDVSPESALEAGLAVEEQDISDLDRAIANTSRADLLQVYRNLRQGSENHTSAFLRQLGR